MTSGYKTIDAMIETVKEKFGKETQDFRNVRKLYFQYTVHYN